MVLLALSAAMLGVTLGFRFTVFVLIPAIGCASVVAGIGWLSGGGTDDSIQAKLLLLVVCLQFGYLGGAAIRFSFGSIGVIRGARMRKSAVGPSAH